MSHEPIGEASFSFYTVLKTDRGSIDKFFLTRMGLLPASVSPYEKQLRVAVNGVEYTYDDGSDPLLITNKWQYETTPKPAQGLLVSDIRIVMGSGVLQITQFGIRDGDGNWYTDLEFGVNVFLVGAGNEERLFDLDGTTQYNDNGSPQTVFVVFDKPRVVSAFGWARSIGGAASIDTIEVAVNVGGNSMLLEDPDYKVAGELTGIVADDYTDPINYNPDKDLLFIEVAASLGKEDDIVNNPVVSVTPDLTEDEDRITIWRETRQDRPHNPPRPGARADGDNLHWFFTQRLFIMQDLCDYHELGAFLDGVPYTAETHDYDAGNQKAEFLNHGLQSVFSIRSIDFLLGIPGRDNLEDQLIVEEGNRTDGTSDFWLDETNGYTINSTALTATRDAGTTSKDVRIRRQTKIDGLWFDLRDKTLSWNSMIIVLLMRQIRNLVQEACFVPTFFAGSMLFNTIFPREWNWLIYGGTDPFFIFGGPFWTGDGEVVVFDNELILTDPTDYTTEFPQITFNDNPDEPHIGTTGNYWSNSASVLPGDPDGSDDADANDPTSDESPIDPLDPLFNAGIAIGISVNFVPTSLVQSGPIEGLPNGLEIETIFQGNGTAFANAMYLKINLVVTQAFGGQTVVGRRVVAYCNTVCNGFGSFGLRCVVQMTDNTGGGSFSVRESGDFTGCGDSGAIVTNVLGMWSDWLAHRGAYSTREIVTGAERAMNQIINSEQNNSIDQLLSTGIVSGLNAIVGQDQAGGGDGTTNNDDLNDVMGP